MALVNINPNRRGMARSALPAVAASRAVAKKQHRHRVVIESVAQEQKQLKTTISFKATPPAGYTFIPAGNPDLTTALKDASRQANRQIIAVTTSTHGHLHDLSKEVHRIGFHFPSVIVAQVCAQYGITLTAAGVVADENAESFRKMRQRGQRGDNNDSKKDQITVNTEARGAIKDLFPKIPENDLYTIIKGAFQKGQKKVGTANELPLVRRAQLSVVAHVRHVYTRYDKLLREVGYREARAQVEGPTLKKLVEWRGDDDNSNGSNQVLEDVFREVIVLSDDDDSEDDTDDVVEVVPRAHGWPLQGHHSVASHQPLSPRQYGYQSADEDAAGYRVVARAPRRRPVNSSPAASASPHFRQSRYAAWDRARAEYRADPTAVPAALVPLSQHDPNFYYQEPEFNFNDPLPRPRQIPINTRGVREHVTYSDRQILHDQPPPQREYVQMTDGYVYEKIYEQPQQGSMHQRRHDPPQAQPLSLQLAPYYEAQDSSSQAIDSNVLPSVEGTQAPFSEIGRSRAPRSNNQMGQAVEHRERQTQPKLQTRNVTVIDLDGADARFAKQHGIQGPGSRRLVDDFDEHRRLSARAGLPEHGARPALEFRRQRTEIIDLSSPKYVREALHNPRMLNERSIGDNARAGEAEGSRSYARSAHSVAEGPAPISRPRYVYGTGPTHHDQDVRFGSSPRVNRGDHDPHSALRAYLPDADYHLEAPALRSADFDERRTATYREILMPAVRATAYDGDRAPFSMDYVPVTTNQPQSPLSPAHRVPQQPPQVIYVDSSPRGPQHERYDPRQHAYLPPDAGRSNPFLFSRLTQA